MSGDLISRDALIDVFNAIMSDKSNGLIDRLFIAGAICTIQTAPAVDAEPVRHGEWEYVPPGRLQCKECKHYINVGNDKNYCPNCGAKMDGGGKDA